MTWRLEVDEGAIYKGDQRFVGLEYEGSNDSWREAMRAGAEIVKLLNAGEAALEPRASAQCEANARLMADMKRMMDTACGIPEKRTVRLECRLCGCQMTVALPWGGRPQGPQCQCNPNTWGNFKTVAQGDNTA